MIASMLLLGGGGIERDKNVPAAIGFDLLFDLFIQSKWSSFGIQ
jgi:hypothetical protein